MDDIVNTVVDDLVTVARREDLTLQTFIDKLKVEYIKTLVEFDTIARPYLNYAPKNTEIHTTILYAH